MAATRKTQLALSGTKLRVAMEVKVDAARVASPGKTHDLMLPLAKLH